MRMARTTIILPEKVLEDAKIKAVKEKTTLSMVITSALTKSYEQKPLEKPKRIHMKLGSLSLGTTDKFRRADLYAEHIKRKMSY